MTRAVDIPQFRAGQIDLSARALNAMLGGSQLAERKRVVPVQPVRARQLLVETQADIAAGDLGAVKIIGYNVDTSGFDTYGDEFDALNLGPANSPAGARVPLTMGEGQVQAFNYFTSGTTPVSSSSSSDSSTSSTSHSSASLTSSSSTSSSSPSSPSGSSESTPEFNSSASSVTEDSSVSSTSSASSASSSSSGAAQAYRVEAYKTSAQSIAGGAGWTKVTWQGTNYNAGGGFSLAGNQFALRSDEDAGYYQVNFHVYWIVPSAGLLLEAQISKDGNATGEGVHRDARTVAASSIGESCVISALVHLADTTEHIEFQVERSGVGNTSIDGSGHPTLTGVTIFGPIAVP